MLRSVNRLTLHFIIIIIFNWFKRRLCQHFYFWVCACEVSLQLTTRFSSLQFSLQGGVIVMFRSAFFYLFFLIYTQKYKPAAICLVLDNNFINTNVVICVG